MLRFDLKTDHGITTARAEIDGAGYESRSANGAINKLCRELVEKGIQDQPWQAYAEDGTLSLLGNSIWNEAKFTYSEGNDGIKRIPYIAYAFDRQGHSDNQNQAKANGRGDIDTAKGN